MGRCVTRCTYFSYTFLFFEKAEEKEKKNCAINCANGDALSGAGAIVKRAEEGDGAERRSGAATSEMRNAWGDVPGTMAARGEERR